VTTIVEEVIRFWAESLQAAHMEIPDSYPSPVYSIPFESRFQNFV
jgi:hypothetical protein